MNPYPNTDELFSAAYQESERGNLLEARGLLQQILAIDPNHIEALVLLGYLSPATEARDYFERALSYLNPYHVQAQRGLLELDASNQQRLVSLLVLTIPLAIIAMAVFVFLGLQFFNNQDEPTPTVVGLVNTSTATITASSTSQHQALRLLLHHNQALPLRPQLLLMNRFAHQHL